MKKLLFTLLLTVVLTGLTNGLLAQVFANNIAGEQLRYTLGYEGIEGSPFFNDKWLGGRVVFVSGEVADMDFIRYDMLEDKLFFLNENKEELLFKKAVSIFILRGAVFQNNFPVVGNLGPANYYQIIGKGQYALLKKDSFTIGQRTEYGIPPTRYFIKDTRYYVFDNKRMKSIKPDAKSLANVFGVKKEAITSYIDENKLDLKTDIGLKTVFEHFSKQS